jgi:hypothetical protein
MTNAFPGSSCPACATPAAPIINNIEPTTAANGQVLSFVPGVKEHLYLRFSAIKQERRIMG